MARLLDALRPFILEGSLTHYYPLTADHPTDVIGGLTVTNPAGGVQLDNDGAYFDGHSYLDLGDHDDFSVTTAGAITVIMLATVTDWRGGPGSSGERVYIAAKGAHNAHEWGFRQYRDGGDREALARHGWINFYHWNPDGGYGAGCRITDAHPAGEVVLGGECHGSHSTGGQVAAFLNGVEQGRRSLSGTLTNGGTFAVTPENRGAPLLLGHRADGEGKFIGRIRDFLTFRRRLTAVEHAYIADAALAAASPPPSCDERLQDLERRVAALESRQAFAVGNPHGYGTAAFGSSSFGSTPGGRQ